jgi:hypothetical protein
VDGLLLLVSQNSQEDASFKFINVMFRAFPTMNMQVDNKNRLQRTLLIIYALQEETGRKSPSKTFFFILKA